MLKIKADKRELMVKPETNLLAKNTIARLITKVNSPKVKKLIGKVKITKIGLITVFKRPKTTTRTTAVNQVSTTTPGTK